MSQLFLDRKKRRALKEKFGYSDATISEAIHFKSQGENARRIRSYAVNVLGAFPVLT